MLEARNIHKAYQDSNKKVSVLKGVDLKIERGKFISIVGPSGAGKSTLLHILGGLDNPTSGHVLFEGKDVYSLTDLSLCRFRNQAIGFVFQFYHLLSEFTVLENVLMPVWIGSDSSLNRQQLNEEARILLRHVGLRERLEHFPGELSGGEQQRVALVRALIGKPAVLLCDEPTGNLDSKTGNEIVALIQKMHRENQMTVVLVTHNMELAGLAEKVYHLKDGMLAN
ncbi:MAG: ABC transporter ATP-binding protein [Candidatus Omnitrophota bacterium]|jgi:lipoprotein-releasing system ATP-binding protein